MRKFTRLKFGLLTTASLMAGAAMYSTSANAWVVFDPWNYEQNLLSAVRNLEEVQNQIKQLTNEAQALAKMDLNLAQLGSSIGGDLKSQMNDIKTLLDKAGGIALSVSQTDAEMKKLFPDDYAKALTNDQSLAQAKTRWTETLSAFKRSMSLEAKVVENTTEDGNALSDLLSKSSTAIGNLQVQQAGNELIGLSVKQQLQLQNLIAADQRAQNLERARTLASQEESRLRFKTFVGTPTAYTP